MNWKLSTLKKLSTIENVVAIKEDTKSLKYGQTILKNFKSRFHVIFAGRKKLILSLKKSGVMSYLNGTSIIDPEIDNIFWTLFKNNPKRQKNLLSKLMIHFGIIYHTNMVGID